MQENDGQGESAGMTALAGRFRRRRASRGEVGRLIDDYLAGLQAAKRSPHTIGGYRNDLNGIAGGVDVAIAGT